jgi:hypothetical protein
MAWIDNGPVSVPSNAVIGVVALCIAVAAVGGVGLGIKASWREMPQPIAAPAPTNTAAAATNTAKEADDSDDIAAKTAAAQAVQSKPAQSSGNIDDILTSSSEKPQAPAKPSTDEAPPQAPKSDVPF